MNWNTPVPPARARFGKLLLAAILLCPVSKAVPADPPRNVSHIIATGPMPRRVHVFEDFETDIEKRWWLRGVPETNNVPPALSIPNRRACRASATKDFDDKMGDATQRFNAVIFNPVPGPPMGPNTRLSFRFWLRGTDTLRVQIYSLTRNFHRFLTLTNLPQESWRAAAVDLTAARRPDGSGGPLSEDERIDDIQFYIAPEADLVIDDIVLYDAAVEGETRPFPKRILFTGWFDTGKQGAEWPGDFEIVPHTPPLTWKAARSVLNAKTSERWIRLDLRGARPTVNQLRFRYRLTGPGDLRVTLANRRAGSVWEGRVGKVVRERWAEASVTFDVRDGGGFADELRFAVAADAELLVDDVLLFEPGGG